MDDVIDLVGALRRRGIADERVLRAMAEVPRERFVPPEHARHAFEDRPLPIGHGQTLSLAVPRRLHAAGARARGRRAGPRPGHRLGPPGGAALAPVPAGLHGGDRPRAAPAHRAPADPLEELGCANVRARLGDGWRGGPEEAPFGGIVGAAELERSLPVRFVTMTGEAERR